MSDRPSKVLTVQGGGFRAVALFVKGDGGWACIEAAPVLHWLKGLPPADARAALERRAWTYAWS